jgi:3',5'-nucleoside bisphosphate phosphatase
MQTANEMRVRASALLCELHAHTTWSDGELSLPELVDLYGRAGFDILCVTDHVLRRDDPWPSVHGRPCVDAETFPAYLEEIERERARALSMFGLLLVPGLELTYNDPDPDRACHAVALCPRRLVAMDDGPDAAMEEARDLGAAVVVAHPYDLGHRSATASPTRYFARRWRELDGLYHRAELFNGEQLFGWVAEKGLMPVAGGDLHRADQLPGWTTLIPCEHDADSFVDYLRSRRPVFLTRLERETRSLAA